MFNSLNKNINFNTFATINITKAIPKNLKWVKI